MVFSFCRRVMTDWGRASGLRWRLPCGAWPPSHTRGRLVSRSSAATVYLDTRLGSHCFMLSGAAAGFAPGAVRARSRRAGQFPAAIKTVAEWFPRRSEPWPRGLFNSARTWVRCSPRCSCPGLLCGGAAVGVHRHRVMVSSGLWCGGRPINRPRMIRISARGTGLYPQ